jgi:hypothetical protein
MKYWEIIAENLKKRGWSLGWVSAIDSNGRTIWIVDAHRGDGKRYVVRADEIDSFLGTGSSDFGGNKQPFGTRRRIQSPSDGMTSKAAWRAMSYIKIRLHPT